MSVPKRFKYKVQVKYDLDWAQKIVNEFGFPGAVYRLGRINNIDADTIELYFRKKSDAVLCLLKF